MLSFRLARNSFALSAALLSFTGIAGAAGAAGQRTYIIPESDGYGIAECFTEGRDCARVVADAWCEAHGNGGVIAYGRAEDTTASTTTGANTNVTHAAASGSFIPGTLIISCGK